MKKSVVYVLLMGLLLSMAGLLAGCQDETALWSVFVMTPSSSQVSETMPAESAELPEKEALPEVQPDVPEFIPQQVSFLAAGDNLIHNVIYQQASRNAGGNGYDFTFSYEAVAPMIAAADISFINQETPLADTIAPPSNYPLFNTPQAMGDHLVNLGFDVVNQATNHTLDMGSKGVQATLDFWKKYPDILVVGLYADEESRHRVHMVEKNGIKMAFVAFTESTNGLSLPAGSPFQLVLMSDEVGIEQEIKRAEETADVVIVSAHWGTEDVHQASEKQQAFARKMVDWGADVIIGHHPHVLQEIEWLPKANGEKALVIYSLGNYISAQKDPQNMVGGMMTWELVRSKADGPIQIEQARFVPTITHYEAGMSNVRIIPFADYTDALAASHGLHNYDGRKISREYIAQLLQRVIPQEFYAAE